ncbi:DNA primase [Candidatus Vondammii sp. HM_W22]|uniref:DNA primase n=1 Tax=Candidatus Vondammii sp. HM_W22 TaxID=2687299 RepID=UPI002E7B2148|nr:DNA primase [Candidatus Vondammii sp. HM_W22]
MTIDTLLSLLEKVRRTGDGKYIACCPAHDDSDPSLAVTDLPDGRILIYCFAGCSPGAVVESLGLSLNDLFPDGGIAQHMHGGTPGYRKQQIQKANDIETDRLILRMAEESRKKRETLSRDDLELEKQAFLNVRNHERKRNGETQWQE